MARKFQRRLRKLFRRVSKLAAKTSKVSGRYGKRFNSGFDSFLYGGSGGGSPGYDSSWVGTGLPGYDFSWMSGGAAPRKRGRRRRGGV